MKKYIVKAKRKYLEMFRKYLLNWWKNIWPRGWRCWPCPAAAPRSRSRGHSAPRRWAAAARSPATSAGEVNSEHSAGAGLAIRAGGDIVASQTGDCETSNIAKVRFQLYSLMVGNVLPFYGFYREVTVSSWLLQCSRSPPTLSPRPHSRKHQLRSSI